MNYIHKLILQKQCGTHINDVCYLNATKHGKMSILEYFHRTKIQRLFYALDEAATYGHLEIVKWLAMNVQDTHISEYGFNMAAANGHLEVVKWLHENLNVRHAYAAMDNAAGNGHLDVVKWLHENRIEGCTTLAIDDAAANGHLDVVKWLHANRKEGWTPDAMCAAHNGHLETVKWLNEHHMENHHDDTRAYDTVATVYQFKHWAKIIRNEHDIMDGAAANGHLHVVKYLHEHKKPCSTMAMDGAAANGHWDVVQWLNENHGDGTPPDITIDQV